MSFVIRHFTVAAFALLIGVQAFAQSTVVTHSPTINAGSSQSAITNVIPRQPIPAPIVTPLPSPGPGHGHHRPHYHRPVYPGYYPHVHTYACYWVNGYYQPQVQQVWVPGYFAKQYVPPRYDLVFVNGRWVRGLVEPGYYKEVWVEGHQETRTVNVWINGYWSCGYY